MNHDTVREAAAKLVAAFGHHRADDYFDCFAESATFVFHNVPRTLRSREEYRTLWAEWETDSGFRVLQCRSSNGTEQVLGDVAVFTHDVTTVIRTAEGDETLLERETIVFARNPGQRWLAVHEHLSPAPAAK